MSMRDLRIGEALAARLCHELVSPVGAIANGVEILAEDAGFAADAAVLIGQSAGEASRRLQFYRIAYGALMPVSVDVARQATLDLFREGRCRCEWPTAAPRLPDEFAKLAMNLLLLATSTLPRGGVIAPSWGDGLVVTAEGQGARIDADLRQQLSPALPVEAISPKTAQAVFTAALATRLGCAIECDAQGPERVFFKVTLVR
jgi:histidine phosphotransferase ChpT